MKEKAEKQSKVISQLLEQMHSSYYSQHIKQNFVVLCQSSDDPEISRTISQFFHTSLQYFLLNNQNYEKASLSGEKFHKQRIANLIVSCRELLQDKNIQGSCAFGLCYYYEQKVYCFRSEGVEIFILNEESKDIKPIAESFKFGSKRKYRNKGIESLYFSTEMSKIKPEFVYQQNDHLKKKIFFDQIDYKKTDNEKEPNLKILIGCPETFDLVSPQILFKNFDYNSKISDCQKVHAVLEEAKKNIKSIYRQDLSLACWKLKNRNSRSSQP